VVRAAAAAVDPSLRVYDVMTLDQVRNASLREIAFWIRLLAMVSGLALLLSLAGIYAVMAYTVSRRTREIGIRVALGADARRVVATIFARPLAQVGAGAAVGGCVAALLVYAVLRDGMWPTGAGLVVVYSAVMMAVCLLACVGPTLKALQVEPVTAIKSD
jgi:putative ABC transport system permease protein